MDFAQLNYYVTTIDEGSFTHAADKLHITQPALSRSLAKLANEVGVQLITIHGRKLSATAAGVEFYDWAVKILADYDAVRKKLQHASTAIPETLTIGVSGLQLIDDTLAQFQYEHQNIVLKTEYFREGDFYEIIRRQDVDCIAASEWFPSNSLNSILLFSERLNAVVPSDHPFADREYLSLQDIRDEDFIFAPKDHLHHKTLMRIFEMAGYAPGVKAYVDTQLRLSLIRKGAGITLWPEAFTRTISSLDDLRVIPISEEYCSRSVYLYWDTRVDGNANFNLLKSFLIEQSTKKS